MIGVKIKAKEVHFFFVEMKKPEITSKYQAEDDQTRLMKQMKDSVDAHLCLELKAFPLLAFGLKIYSHFARRLLKKNTVSNVDNLIRFRCTLFRMKLVTDGIYVSVAIDRFFLVEEFRQLIHLPSIVEAFYFVKVLIVNQNF